MKKIYLISAGVILAVVAFAVYSQFIKPQLDNRTITAVVPTVIAQPDLDFEFSYPSGEAGLSLIEPPIATTSESMLRKVFIMMQTEDYIDYQGKEGAEDAPPTISVLVFDNQADEGEGGRVTRLQNWAQTNSVLTGFDQLSAETEVVEIDGAKALHYQSVGEYKKDIYLISHSGNVYLFVGQYQEEGDYLQTTFKDLIGSILFY